MGKNIETVKKKRTDHERYQFPQLDRSIGRELALEGLQILELILILLSTRGRVAASEQGIEHKSEGINISLIAVCLSIQRLRCNPEKGNVNVVDRIMQRRGRTRWCSWFPL